jgi:hypothetical protein
MIGRQLLNYDILERLGAGGHGEVYRAVREFLFIRHVYIQPRFLTFEEGLTAIDISQFEAPAAVTNSELKMVVLARIST